MSPTTSLLTEILPPADLPDLTLRSVLREKRQALADDPRWIREAQTPQMVRRLATLNALLCLTDEQHAEILLNLRRRTLAQHQPPVPEEPCPMPDFASGLRAGVDFYVADGR